MIKYSVIGYRNNNEINVMRTIVLTEEREPNVCRNTSKPGGTYSGSLPRKPNPDKQCLAGKPMQFPESD